MALNSKPSYKTNSFKFLKRLS